jgi:hypothetical protein
MLAERNLPRQGCRSPQHYLERLKAQHRESLWIFGGRATNGSIQMCHNGAQNGELAGAAAAGWCRERETIVDLPVERRRR